jgi:tetratricopeptide (TPR) repeat protein
VGVKANVIRGWIRHGLLVPASTNGGLQLFDFGQVSRLRTLNELANNGVSPDRIREGIQQLGNWLDDESPLQLLAAIESHRRRLVVRLKDGRLTEPRGQLLFDFEDSEPGDINILSLPTTPLLERALDYEEDGELELAAAVYAEVLERGDVEPETRFNFANVLYQLGRMDEAIDLFERALDRDSEYVEAWNNLGSAYLDLDRTEDAILAFRKAIDVRPTYADAHFNLATTLDESGRADESRSHWVAFLNLSDEARKSTRIRTRRTTARHHFEDDDDDAPQILRFEAQ